MIAPIRASEYRRVAWNNGGGTTADIDVGQESMRFAWRLSMADIERDGPFSDFTGCDRTIVLAKGRGFALDADGTTVILDRPYAIHRFDGACAPMCRLLDGPALAFNVMSARATHVHDVTVCRFAESFEVEPDGVLYIVLLHGGASLAPENGPAAAVAAGDTVRADGGHVTVRATAEAAVAAIVRVRPRSG